MNAEHTPGPWFAELDHVVARTEEGGYLSRQSSIAICYAEEDQMENYKNPEVLANARLIAAAPDLLAACINALDQLKDVDEHYPCHRSIIELRRAIAKATQPTHAGETAAQA